MVFIEMEEGERNPDEIVKTLFGFYEFEPTGEDSCRHLFRCRFPIRSRNGDDGWLEPFEIVMGEIAEGFEGITHEDRPFPGNIGWNLPLED